MTTTVTVTNPTRSRKFGFGYSTTPERNSTRIIPPGGPDWTGTIATVKAHIENSATFAFLRSGGTYMATQWFYDGKAIVGLNGEVAPHLFNEWLSDLDANKWLSATYHEPFTPKPITLILAD